MKKRPDILGRDRERVRIDAEDPALALVPHAFAARKVPVPRAHLSGGERKRAAPLALPESRRRSLELRSTVGDAVLQLPIELLELARLAVKLGKNLDLGPQHVGDDRDRNII